VSDVKVKAKAASEDQVTTWINLNQTARVIQGLLEDRLRAETDLSWAEFELLMRLQVSAGHPLQMSEIAAQLVGSPSGTTRIADRLEKDGLISRETPRENRRIVRVVLTERGRKVLAEADEKNGDTRHAYDFLRTATRIEPSDEKNYIELITLCIDHKNSDLAL